MLSFLRWLAMLRIARFLTGCTLAIILAGCSNLSDSAGAVGGVSLQQGDAAKLVRGPGGPGAARYLDSRHPWLYVAVNYPFAIEIFDLGQEGTPLIETITQGLNYPAGIALDSGGTLYVPNQAANDVTVYAPGDTSPSLTLTGVNAPQGVVVDAQGDVFVCYRGDGGGIAAYPAGQTTPSQLITSGLMTMPNQLAFGSDGTLYVSDNVNGVLTIAPGTSNVVSLGLESLAPQPSGIAIDQVTQAIFVSSATMLTLQEYKPGKKKPSKTFWLPNNACFISIGVIRGDGEKVFAPNCGAGEVYVYPSTLKKVRTIRTTTGNLDNAVLKPAGVP
jgi:hypothetical protein